MMTRGRTGSTAVMDSLNKTHSLTTAQELFIKFKVNKKSSYTIKQSERIISRYDIWRQQSAGLLSVISEKLLRSDALIVQYLDEVENSVKKSGLDAFGFKVISHHFKQRPGLKENLMKRGYSAVYLTRNIPRQVISGIVAKKRGKYNAHEKENYQNDSSFLIDIDNFRSLIELEQKSQQEDLTLLQAMGIDYTVIRYEDFVSNPDQLFSDILSFLNLPSEKAPESSYSIMIGNLRETIENYEQVCECTKQLGMSLD